MHYDKIALNIPEDLYDTASYHIREILTEGKDFYIFEPRDQQFNTPRSIVEKWITIRLCRMWLCTASRESQSLDVELKNRLDNHLQIYDEDLYELQNTNELGSFSIQGELIDPFTIILEIDPNECSTNIVQRKRSSTRNNNYYRSYRQWSGKDRLYGARGKLC